MRMLRHCLFPVLALVAGVAHAGTWTVSPSAPYKQGGNVQVSYSNINFVSVYTQGAQSALIITITRPDGTVAASTYQVGAAGSPVATNSLGVGAGLSQIGTWTVTVDYGQFYNGSVSSIGRADSILFSVDASTTLPTVVVTPSSATVATGTAQTYVATVAGSPSPSLQWYVSSNLGSTWTAIGGATTSSYTTPAAAVGMDKYYYECVAINAAGSASAYGILYVPTSQPQTVTMNADHTSVTVGTSEHLTTSGSHTSYTFTDASGGTSGLPSGFPTANVSSGPISFSYTFNTVGTYTIYGHAPAGNGYLASSNDTPVTISVTKRLGATPKITPTSADVAATEAVVFTASEGSTGNYVWSTSSGHLSASTGSSVTWTPGGTSTGATVSVRDDGDAFYSASAEASATVTIKSATTAVPPRFIAQPSDVSITYGQNAGFSALASGDPAPGYRWELSSDGGRTWSNVAGSSSASLALNRPVVTASGSRYRCVASNAAGSATSNAASLTVVPALQGPLTLTPNSARLSPGARMDFSVTGGATGNYAWTSSGGSLSSSSGSAPTWTAPLLAGSQTVTVTDRGDENTCPSDPASAAIDVASSLLKQPAVALTPTMTTTQTALSVAFVASGGAGTGAFVWTCASGKITGSGTTATWVAPATEGNTTVSVYRQGDASYEVSNTAVSTVSVLAAGAPVLTLSANPLTTTPETRVTLIWEGQNVLGAVNLGLVSAPIYSRCSNYIGTFGASGSQSVYLDVAGTYQFEAQAPVQGLYARTTVVVNPPATTKMISLVPVASTATVNGRTYNRLWSNGSSWYAYLARRGLSFTATGQGENAASLFELQAKSPVSSSTFQTIATAAVSGVPNGPGVSVAQTFQGLMIDGPSTESPLVPASLASGAPLTGTWLFRARVQDSKGAWSAYSDAVPVTAALPIVARGDTLQSHPPAGAEGGWFTESSPKTYSFQLWLP